MLSEPARQASGLRASQMKEQEAQTSEATLVLLARQGPLAALGLVGGRGHRPEDICNRPRPPNRPFIEALSWADWVPRGEPFRGRAQHSEGCRGRPRGPWPYGWEASACERGWAFTASCLGPLKHICWAQPRPGSAFLELAEGSRLGPGQPHKAIPTQDRPERSPWCCGARPTALPSSSTS